MSVRVKHLHSDKKHSNTPCLNSLCDQIMFFVAIPGMKVRDCYDVDNGCKICPDMTEKLLTGT